MGPVRIKYYGVLWLTRPTYIILQSIALFLCVALMAVGFLTMFLTGIIAPHLPAPGDEADFFKQFLVLLFWAGLLGLLAESVEMYVMLRAFTRAEAEQQAPLAALDAGEPAPFVLPADAVQLAPNEHSSTNIQP